MNRGSLRYEGKAKRVYETEDPTLYIMEYKDDATAFNGEKKGTIEGKGVVNNHMSNVLMRLLADMGVPNHFVSELSEREVLVRAVEIVPLEVIVRNVAAGIVRGALRRRRGHRSSPSPRSSSRTKSDELGDPLINSPHARLGLASASEIERIKGLALKIDEILVKSGRSAGCASVDFKVEFGRSRRRGDPRRRDKP